MKTLQHLLAESTPGTAHRVTSLHFGTPGGGPKAYIQASLHADEVPAMLVAWHLRRSLAALDAAGRIQGEVVLVPAANPIGLSQFALQVHQGRFDLASGDNFNRSYADLAAAVAPKLAGLDAGPTVAQVRAALREAVAALPVRNALTSLRQTLLGLAADADIVLDLHCDGEAVLHAYTTPACWPEAELLARCMGLRAVLLAEHSGGDPFDEACSMLWPDLATRLGKPLPQACLSLTVELRGEADVDHVLAAADAAGILHFLQLRGIVAGTTAPPPPLLCQPTPLAASIPMPAPRAGVVVFHQGPGARVRQGDPVAEIIDPVTGEVSTVTAPTDGLLFARCQRRYTAAGLSLGKVAGTEPRRSGPLLSA